MRSWRNFARKGNREMYSSWRDDDKIKGGVLEWTTLGHVFILLEMIPGRRSGGANSGEGGDNSRSKVLEVTRAAGIQSTCWGIGSDKRGNQHL